MNDFSRSLKVGDLIALEYEGKKFEAIVIDPSGLGADQPSVGFGYRMGERHAGIPESTARGWVREKEGVLELEVPSGKGFRVREISASDGNIYRVIEVSDWFAIAVDLLINPGRTKKKGMREKLGNFITWFAVKGFYAEAYVALKGAYTARDSRATTKWMEARQIGKGARKLYTDLLQSEGCKSNEFAQWTDYVYQGLFGMRASAMKEQWELMEGRPEVARNYIPKVEAIEAVQYCEDMVVRMFVDDLKESHDMAINLTKRKFLQDED